METMKLIPCSQFILEQSEKYLNGFTNLTDYQRVTEAYAKFLSQPLGLWMFAPVLESGEVMEEPPTYAETFAKNGNRNAKEHIRLYSEAKQRCLFEGFKYISPWFGNHIVAKDEHGTGQITFNNTNTVEKILRESTGNISLTQTAKEMIFGNSR